MLVLRMPSVALVSQYAIVCRSSWKVRVNVVRMCELLNIVSSFSCPFERNGCRTREKTHCYMYPYSEQHARPQKQVESASGKLCLLCKPNTLQTLHGKIQPLWSPAVDCSIQAACGPIFLVYCHMSRLASTNVWEEFPKQMEFEDILTAFAVTWRPGWYHVKCLETSGGPVFLRGKPGWYHVIHVWTCMCVYVSWM